MNDVPSAREMVAPVCTLARVSSSLKESFGARMARPKAGEKALRPGCKNFDSINMRNGILNDLELMHCVQMLSVELRQDIEWVGGWVSGWLKAVRPVGRSPEGTRQERHEAQLEILVEGCQPIGALHC